MIIGGAARVSGARSYQSVCVAVETRLLNLPAGDYVITAIVIDSLGEAAAFAGQGAHVIP